jgi:hypothetical protein
LTNYRHTFFCFTFLFLNMENNILFIFLFLNMEYNKYKKLTKNQFPFPKEGGSSCLHHTPQKLRHWHLLDDFPPRNLMGFYDEQLVTASHKQLLGTACHHIGLGLTEFHLKHALLYYITWSRAIQYFNIQAASLVGTTFVCVLTTPHRYITTCRIKNDRYTISNVFPFFPIRYYNLLAGMICTLCLPLLRPLIFV